MAFRYTSAFVIKEHDPELKDEAALLMSAVCNASTDAFETDWEGREIKVNDTAVVLNGTALMCSPSGSNNIRSISLMKNALKNNVSIRTVDLSLEGAKLKGGDVLFTGQEIIVGLSADTNEIGAQCVAKTFPEYSTATINVLPPYAALRHAICVVADNVLALNNDDAAKKMMQEFRDVASHKYSLLYLEEQNAADTIFLNKRLITHTADVIPSSYAIFENKLDKQVIPVTASKHLSRGIHLVDRVLPVCPAGTHKNIASTMP